MYFTQFESYETAMGEAKTFCFEVKTTIGQVIRSSDMPAVVLNSVRDYIDICEEARSAIYVWDHTSKSMTVVPYHSITTIRVILLA